MNIMDPVFNGMGRSEMYRAQLFPELFPHEQEMILDNWTIQDLEEYCGGEYTEGYADREWIKHYGSVPQRYILGAE